MISARILGSGAASIEGHTDPRFPAPDDVARHLQPLGPEDQREIFGDADRAGYLERCSDGRQVANHAIDRATAELDRSGLQNATTWKGPLFVHEAGKYAQCLSKWLKLGRRLPFLVYEAELNLLFAIQDPLSSRFAGSEPDIEIKKAANWRRPIRTIWRYEKARSPPLGCSGRRYIAHPQS
jgi:hypothetical protein